MDPTKNKDEQIKRLKELIQEINNLMPKGREKALAANHLEEVEYWASAAIERNT